jgi:hypothetical protein
VGDVGQRPELVLEAIDADGVDATQELERYARIAFPIVGAIHDAHGTTAEAGFEDEPLGSAELAADRADRPRVRHLAPPPFEPVYTAGRG